MTFIYALVLLGILIFVHELGHFLFAKLANVKVLKFSLGFGPKVLGRKFGETEYQISAVPLGGYVKMLGEESGDEITDEDRLRAYNFQPVWKRVLIVLAGPVFNILSAAVIFIMIFMSGVPALLPEVGEVVPGSPAASAGLTKGDNIVEVNGVPIRRWDEMTEIIHKNPGVKIDAKVKRDGRILDVSLTPERKDVPDIFGEKKEVGLIGIKPSGGTFTEKESPVGALRLGVERTWDISVLTIVSIVKLIQRVIPAETIGGPILIFQMAGQQASYGAVSFFSFLAIISINLGVLNLLPIPMLDGGHIMFLSIEAVRRKPLSEKVIMIAQRTGLAIIITLMVFAFYNDIMRLITGKMMP
ncbi:MAG: RIP metalloprotease RseP [Nitrospirae bacterium]|nr:RIP metalloprotease RseP [Nitrospirota bacterium]